MRIATIDYISASVSTELGLSCCSIPHLSSRAECILEYDGDFEPILWQMWTLSLSLIYTQLEWRKHFGLARALYSRTVPARWCWFYIIRPVNCTGLTLAILLPVLLLLLLLRPSRVPTRQQWTDLPYRKYATGMTLSGFVRCVSVSSNTVDRDRRPSLLAYLARFHI